MFYRDHVFFFYFFFSSYAFLLLMFSQRMVCVCVSNYCYWSGLVPLCILVFIALITHLIMTAKGTRQGPKPKQKLPFLFALEMPLLWEWWLLQMKVPGDPSSQFRSLIQSYSLSVREGVAEPGGRVKRETSLESRCNHKWTKFNFPWILE